MTGTRAVAGTVGDFLQDGKRACYSRFFVGERAVFDLIFDRGVGSSRWTAAINSGGSMGFFRNLAFLSGIFSEYCEAYAEMISIGTSGHTARILPIRSKPLSLGITTSVMIRSTWYLQSKNSAWSPSAAWMTSWLSFLSASANALRVMASSSTRRITALLYSQGAYEKQGSH